MNTRGHSARQGFVLVVFGLALLLVLSATHECISFGLGCRQEHDFSNFRPLSEIIVKLRTTSVASSKSGSVLELAADGEHSASRPRESSGIQDATVPLIRGRPDRLGAISISHIFSPYTMNDEFQVVSSSWKIAADKAKREAGIHVELIAAVLPEDVKAAPPFARVILLKQRIQNYRAGANDVPTYGEMFRVLRDEAQGSIVVYSNADIAVVPDFYIKIRALMQDDQLNTRERQIQILQETKQTFFAKCKELENDGLTESDQLCARDAVVYYENQGGRPPHYPEALESFFRDPLASSSAASSFDAAYDPARPDQRVYGHSLTITRRQLPKAKPKDVLAKLFTDHARDDINLEVLRDMYEQEGEDHPGNDLFVMPRAYIPQLLTETPFIHLRPSGFLIGQLLKYHPKLVFRRITSTASNPYTFHVGLGTDEYMTRAQLQPRQVLFEVAQYFTRQNLTRTSFWPPEHCAHGTNYRIGGTRHFCENVPGDYCRGWVRLSCTTYWHRSSRDTLALEHLCERVSRRVRLPEEPTQGKVRLLDEPFCSFCNDVSDFPVGSAAEDKKQKFKCTGQMAEECKEYPCDPFTKL